MIEMAQNFTKGTCMPNRRVFLSVDLLGPNGGHVLVVLGPCFGYFYNMYASRRLKWLTFSLKSLAYQIGEYSSILNYWDHIENMFWAISGQNFGYFYNIFASRCLKWLKISLKRQACQVEEYSLMLTYWGHIGPML